MASALVTSPKSLQILKLFSTFTVLLPFEFLQEVFSLKLSLRLQKRKTPLDTDRDNLSRMRRSIQGCPVSGLLSEEEAKKCAYTPTIRNADMFGKNGEGLEEYARKMMELRDKKRKKSEDSDSFFSLLNQIKPPDRSSSVSNNQNNANGIPNRHRSLRDFRGNSMNGNGDSSNGESSGENDPNDWKRILREKRLQKELEEKNRLKAEEEEQKRREAELEERARLKALAEAVALDEAEEEKEDEKNRQNLNDASDLNDASTVNDDNAAANDIANGRFDVTSSISSTIPPILSGESADCARGSRFPSETNSNEIKTNILPPLPRTIPEEESKNLDKNRKQDDDDPEKTITSPKEPKEKKKPESKESSRSPKTRQVSDSSESSRNQRRTKTPTTIELELDDPNNPNRHSDRTNNNDDSNNEKSQAQTALGEFVDDLAKINPLELILKMDFSKVKSVEVIKKLENLFAKLHKQNRWWFPGWGEWDMSNGGENPNPIGGGITYHQKRSENMRNWIIAKLQSISPEERKKIDKSIRDHLDEMMLSDDKNDLRFIMLMFRQWRGTRVRRKEELKNSMRNSTHNGGCPAFYDKEDPSRITFPDLFINGKQAKYTTDAESTDKASGRKIVFQGEGERFPQYGCEFPQLVPHMPSVAQTHSPNPRRFLSKPRVPESFVCRGRLSGGTGGAGEEDGDGSFWTPAEELEDGAKFNNRESLPPLGPFSSVTSAAGAPAIPTPPAISRKESPRSGKASPRSGRIRNNSPRDNSPAHSGGWSSRLSVSHPGGGGGGASPRSDRRSPISSSAFSFTRKRKSTADPPFLGAAPGPGAVPGPVRIVSAVPDSTRQWLSELQTPRARRILEHRSRTVALFSPGSFVTGFQVPVLPVIGNFNRLPKLPKLSELSQSLLSGVSSVPKLQALSGVVPKPIIGEESDTKPASELSSSELSSTVDISEVASSSALVSARSSPSANHDPPQPAPPAHLESAEQESGGPEESAQEGINEQQQGILRHEIVPKDLNPSFANVQAVTVVQEPDFAGVTFHPLVGSFGMHGIGPGFNFEAPV